MANRYWVGGDAQWDSSAGSKWATSSGGAGGASVPGSSDTAIFDANSGTATVALNSPPTIGLLDTENFTGSFTGTDTITIAGVGTIKIGANVSWPTYGITGAIDLSVTGAVLLQDDRTFTSSGRSSCFRLLIDGSSAEVTLSTDFAGERVVLTEGLFDTDDNQLGLIGLSVSGANSKTIDLGASSVWIGATFDLATGSNLTFTAGTSTVTFTGTFGSPLQPDGNTFYSVVITGDVEFANGDSLTATSFVANGTQGSPISIDTDSAGTAWTLSVSSGLITVNFCSLKDCAASGGATFLARNCTDVSGNSGWRFTEPGAGMAAVL